MSRITVGYHLDKDLRNLFGNKIIDMRNFLEHVKNATKTDILAWFSSHYNVPSLKIKVDGELHNLETALDNFVNFEGIPDFVVNPRSDYERFSLIKTRLYGVKEENSPTTQDAYQLIKKLYSSQKIKTCALDNGTLAIDRGYI